MKSPSLVRLTKNSGRLVIEFAGGLAGRVHVGPMPVSVGGWSNARFHEWIVLVLGYVSRLGWYQYPWAGRSSAMESEASC